MTIRAVEECLLKLLNLFLKNEENDNFILDNSLSYRKLGITKTRHIDVNRLTSY